MNDAPESDRIHRPDSGCRHCRHWAVIETNQGQHRPELGSPEEMRRAGSGCRLGMNDAPESGLIHRPDSDCRHWAVIKTNQGQYRTELGSPEETSRAGSGCRLG
ncbi:hypothetical protein VZT92_014573 [Zoarces viviparus]|uniref:Uncharacterized protein n=1 Tax=Zoarces viviparus TaxID=48416 RepID=A0AAW1F092_ZOAVI